MIEGLISLTLFTTKGVTTKPLLGLVVTNGLALLGGTAVGGLVTHRLNKRWQEQERLSQALEAAQTQAQEVDGLRQALAEAQAQAQEAEGLRQALQEAQGQAEEVDDLRQALQEAQGQAQEVTGLRQALQEAHQAQAQETERLRQEAQAQAQEVDGLRQALQEAQAEIGQLLSNAAEMAQVVETAEASEGEASELSVEVPEVAEAVPPPVPDNLKKIKGIGKVFQARLNEAGIWTFAALVETEPERLREIVSSGRVENMIQPEEWIEQAREWVE